MKIVAYSPLQSLAIHLMLRHPGLSSECGRHYVGVVKIVAAAQSFDADLCLRPFVRSGLVSKCHQYEALVDETIQVH